MMEKMYDLAWKIDGDVIRLTQEDGCGESSVVDLHTSQLRLLAERTGLLGVYAQTESERRLERSIRLLLRKLIELQSVVLDQREYEPETWLRLPLIMEIAGILFEDITRERPYEEPDDDDGHKGGEGEPAPGQRPLC